MNSVIKDKRRMAVRSDGRGLFFNLSLTALGLSSPFTINMVGVLPVPEMVLLALAIFFFFTKFWMREEFTKNVVIFVCIWLVFQIITDRIRDIPLADSLRGVAKITMFGAALFSLWFLLKGNVVRVGYFLVGLGLSFALGAMIYPNEAIFIDPWKWAYGPAVTTVILGVLCVLAVSSRFIWAATLFALGATHFLLNARSMGGGCILPGMLILMGPVWNRIPVYARVIVSVAGALLLLFAYSIAAERGVLGEVAAAKYAAQRREDGSFVTVLTSGRKEHRASFKAISDSPFLGYGSWARHPEYYTYILDDNQRLESLAAYAEIGIIPTHSHVLGAWVDAGPVPGLLWLIVAIIFGFRVLKLRIVGSANVYIALYMGIVVLWGIFFSPLGVGQRVSTALGFVIVFSAPLLGGVKYLDKKL